MDNEQVVELHLTERETKEIQHALYCERHCNHGTTGHNQLLLIAKMAKALGLTLSMDNATVVSADNG